MCQVVSQVVHLNNEGIQMLETKNYDKAIRALSTAISTFKTSLSIWHHSENTDAPPVLEHELFFAFQLNTNATTKASSDDEDAPFVFESPIRVTLRSNHQTKNIKEDDMLRMLSFSVVFNLALAFHLSSMNSSNNNSSSIKKRLTKALAFYKLAVDIIHNENLALGAMEALAMANNQAHVHVMMGAVKEAENCYRQVHNQIMMVAARGHQRKILQFEMFFATAVVSKLSKTAAAA
jgi:tetratricopeptide (TPR) repeat protein